MAREPVDLSLEIDTWALSLGGSPSYWAPDLPFPTTRVRTRAVLGGLIREYEVAA